jgi:hypothetical protein
MLFYIKLNPEHSSAPGVSKFHFSPFLSSERINHLLQIDLDLAIGRKQAQGRKSTLAGASSEERFHSAQSTHTPLASAGCNNTKIKQYIELNCCLLATEQQSIFEQFSYFLHHVKVRKIY